MRSFKQHLEEGIERVARLAGALDKRKKKDPNFGDSPKDQGLIDAFNRAQSKLQRRQISQSPTSWDRSHLAFQTKLRFGKINQELLDRHLSDLMQHKLSDIYLDHPIDGTPTRYTMIDIMRAFRDKRPLRPKHVDFLKARTRTQRRRPPPPEFS